jgi:chorismate mutase
MNQTALLLNAYYEALHDLLVANKPRLVETAENLLREEIKNHSFGSFNRNKYDAYLDACLAFIAERIEMYNPIGIQYTVDRIPSGLAQELELQLNFYDSRSEFQQLKDAAAELTQQGFSDDQLPQLAARLIAEHGAFPDKSIISAYRTDPALNKLPDYITALSIEKIIKA